VAVQGEVETTYEAGLDLDLATVLDRAVADVEGLSLSGEPEHRGLDATYFDTADLRLAQVGITLRRRTGGDDAGWHLKIPHRTNEKVEKHVPLSAARHRVPAPLRRLVGARVLDQDLVPVARIRTERDAYAITGSEESPQAEVADDRVEASRLGEGEDVEAVLVWREVEIELTGGSTSVMDELDRRVRARGLVPSQGAARSKLLRVLGDDVPAGPTPPSSPDATAAELVLHHLGDQVEQLRSFDPLVRMDRPDSVHTMRVATRRLRSALKTFGPLLDPEQVVPLRAELAWLGGHLGPARDAEVMAARLRQLAQEEEPQSAAGRLALSCAGAMERHYSEHHRQARRAMDSARYDALVRDLVALTASPTFTSLAGRPSGEVLPALVRRAFRTLKRTMPTALAEQQGAPSSEERDRLLHDARKKAKRVRYAAEALIPAYGAPAARMAADMEQVQADLGEHQDSVVLRGWLQQWASEASAPKAFTLGRWDALEQRRGRDAEHRCTRSWATAGKKKRRRWLKSTG